MQAAISTPDGARRGDVSMFRGGLAAPSGCPVAVPSRLPCLPACRVACRVPVLLAGVRPGCGSVSSGGGCGRCRHGGAGSCPGSVLVIDTAVVCDYGCRSG